MTTDLLGLKAKLKKIRKNFKRTEWNKRKKLGEKWRRAKGRDNKIRRGLDGYKVKAGYGTPNKLKSLHPRGLKEIIVNNMEELKKVDAKNYVVRIASKVGLKNREEMLKYAKENGIHILNASLKARRAKRKIKEQTSKIKEEKRKKKEQELIKKSEEKKDEKKETKDDKNPGEPKSDEPSKNSEKKTSKTKKTKSESSKKTKKTDSKTSKKK